MLRGKSDSSSSFLHCMLACMPAGRVCSQSKPDPGCCCCRGNAPEGYQSLPGEPDQGAWAVAVKQRQEAAAASCEKLLMEVYNALCALCSPLNLYPPACDRQASEGWTSTDSTACTQQM